MDKLKIFPKNATINSSGHLEIAGLDVSLLAEEYGTPLFVYDEDHIRSAVRSYREAFAEQKLEAMVAYAGKAFLCLYLARIMAEEGAYLDCVTGGEVYTALKAGFPPEKIFFHGNNKSEEELHFAMEAGVGYIVLDSFDEINRLKQLLLRHGKKQKVLIRITPGIIPKTHTYIQTGQVDSKFGFSLATGQAYEAVLEVLSSDELQLKGFHMHIGSQIFALDPYRAAVQIMAEFVAMVKEKTSYEPEIVNFGGGVGVAYRLTDEPPSIKEFVFLLSEAVKEEFPKRGLRIPAVAVEPGRSIVGPAAVTLYRIGTVKEIVGIRLYVSVDGGMSDNLRPMLYGAVYEAFIATKMDKPPETRVTIAGKHCENGDILIRDVEIPYPQVGDLLVTPVTGAYGYAMANNYNLQPRPAVVFVRDGQAKLVIRRETYADLIRNQEL
jgi:diaminopimelate decarboxylase